MTNCCMANNVYWIGMKRDMCKYVAEHDICQRNKYQALSPASLLSLMPIPMVVPEDVSLDFITTLPKSKEYKVILVVVDKFPKYKHPILLKHLYFS